MHEQEAASAVSAFRRAGFQAALAEGRRLLVAKHAGDGRGGAEPLLFTKAKIHRAVAYFRQNAPRNFKQFQQFLVPVAAFQIEQQGARGVGRVGPVAAAAGQLPEQKTVHGAGGEFAALGAFAQARHFVQQPLQFGGGKVRVQQQAGFALQLGFKPAFPLKFAAMVRGAPVLPDDGPVYRFAASPVPQHRGFPLIGDADAGQLPPFDAGVDQSGAAARQGGLPDFPGIVFHPTIPGEVLGEFLLPQAAWLASGIENQGAA